MPAAALDLVAGLAQAAAEGLWSEPELVDDTSLALEGGRHPVAERLLEAQGRAFVPNDCRMEAAERIWLLTGPNRAGKSTFLVSVRCWHTGPQSALGPDDATQPMSVGEVQS